uniref:RING-type domain-containing protein n=1 Tax=Anopheles funestus TaxID=62324 RepID=A0A4Y0BQY6_ANOFN
MSKVTECPICLESFDNYVKKLSCEHRFHPRCIDMWLEIAGHCPICLSCPTSYSLESADLPCGEELHGTTNDTSTDPENAPEPNDPAVVSVEDPPNAAASNGMFDVSPIIPLCNSIRLNNLVAQPEAAPIELPRTTYGSYPVHINVRTPMEEIHPTNLT